jgi:secretion/DNA translocation related TadE-like protein
MRSRDQGAVTVLLVAVLGLVVVLAGVVGEVGAVVTARQRAATAADLSALAAHDGGCVRAAVIARIDGGRLRTCRRQADGSVVVSVAVVPAGPGGRAIGSVVVSARAGEAGS